MFEPELRPETARQLKQWREKKEKKPRKAFALPKPEGELTPKQLEDRRAHEAAAARLAETGN